MTPKSRYLFFFNFFCCSFALLLLAIVCIIQSIQILIFIHFDIISYLPNVSINPLFTMRSWCPNRCCSSCVRQLELLNRQHPINLGQHHRQHLRGERRQQLVGVLGVQLDERMERHRIPMEREQQLEQPNHVHHNRMVRYHEPIPIHRRQGLGCLHGRPISIPMRMVCQWFLSVSTLVPNCTVYGRCFGSGWSPTGRSIVHWWQPMQRKERLTVWFTKWTKQKSNISIAMRIEPSGQIIHHIFASCPFKNIQYFGGCYDNPQQSATIKHHNFADQKNIFKGLRQIRIDCIL